MLRDTILPDCLALADGAIRGRNNLTKRFLDVVLGGLLALIILPVVAVFAIGLALSLRCSPFFVHKRVGYRGRVFRLIKLRTLPRNAPPYANKYEVSSIRVPPLARFLRQSHLDELPQLFLVPLGRMSLVGPRPEMPHLHAEGDQRFAESRTSARPGCTGLWQLSPDANRLIWDAPWYDEFYLRHSSVRLDLWVLWRTLLHFSRLGQLVTIDRVPHWVLRPDKNRPPIVAA